MPTTVSEGKTKAVRRQLRWRVGTRRATGWADGRVARRTARRCGRGKRGEKIGMKGGALTLIKRPHAGQSNGGWSTGPKVRPAHRRLSVPSNYSRFVPGFSVVFVQ